MTVGLTGVDLCLSWGDRVGVFGGQWGHESA